MPESRVLKIRTLIISALIVLVVAIVFSLYNNHHPSKSKLPDISLSTLTGKQINLNSFRGQPVVLNLWATWCPPCKAELPLLIHYQHQFPSIHFIYAEQGNRKQNVAEFAHKHNLPASNVLLDTNTTLSKQFGVLGYPTTVFFNSHGQIIDIHKGELNSHTLKSLISKINLKS